MLFWTTLFAAVFVLANGQCPPSGFESPDQCPEYSASQSFSNSQLAAFGSCGELAESEDGEGICWNVHEAFDEKCPCVCDFLKCGITPAPATDATTAPDGKGGKCFHGDDMVTTEEGEIKMEDLVKFPDSKVLTIDENDELVYAPVSYWIHASSETKSEFRVLRTESGQELSLSPLHLIYRVPCDGNGPRTAIFAKRIMPGTCVLTESDGEMVPTKVSQVSVEEKSGVYSPITSTGSIVVNGIAASCYSTLEQETLLHYGFSVILRLRSFLPAMFQGIGSEIDVPAYLAATADLMNKRIMPSH